MRVAYPVLIVCTALVAGCTVDDTPSIGSVQVTTAPATAEPGSSVQVCWHVDGDGTIDHTAVHIDTESHAGGDATFGSYDGAAPGYPGGSDTGSYDLPGDFCTPVTMPVEGDLYLVAHAMHTGAEAGDEAPPGVLSDEHRIMAA